MNIDKLKPEKPIFKPYTIRTGNPIAAGILAVLSGAVAGILLGAALVFFTPPSVSEGVVDGVRTHNGPYFDLNDYQLWSLPDSLLICGPSGTWSKPPSGSLLLTPIPREIPERKFY